MEGLLAMHLPTFVVLRQDGLTVLAPNLRCKRLSTTYMTPTFGVGVALQRGTALKLYQSTLGMNLHSSLDGLMMKLINLWKFITLVQVERI
jgi:hypothetical protein